LTLHNRCGDWKHECLVYLEGSFQLCCDNHVWSDRLLLEAKILHVLGRDHKF
jgi:hypothetical protein